MFHSLKYHDWFLNAAIFFIALASLVMIFSAAPALFWTQVFWFTLSFALIFFLAQIDWRAVINYRWIIFGFYLGAVALLLATLFFAPVIRETRGWLVIGNFQFQPAELAKVALIVLLAYFFARRHIGIAHMSNLAVSLIYCLIPALIIFRQPDWGSALILISLWIGFLLVSGIRWRHLIIGAVILVLAFSVSWGFLLKNYQKERIIGFLKPDYDPLGVNYSVIQSKIAIGSAGFFGKGFRQGTQTQLNFLPEPATDFIFAAFVEEWGLVGGLLLVAAFVFLTFRIISIGLRSDDNFSKLVCLGAVILFLLEFIFNVGSNIGFFPVIGVTFPFLSYGGSSILTKALLISIIQSTAIRARI